VRRDSFLPGNSYRKQTVFFIYLMLRAAYRPGFSKAMLGVPAAYCLEAGVSFFAASSVGLVLNPDRDLPIHFLLFAP